MTLERECIVWCPACKVDIFEVVRLPTGREGVFHNERRAMNESTPPKSATYCDRCGHLLERKPDG